MKIMAPPSLVLEPFCLVFKAILVRTLTRLPFGIS